MREMRKLFSPTLSAGATAWPSVPSSTGIGRIYSTTPSSPRCGRKRTLKHLIFSIIRFITILYSLYFILQDNPLENLNLAFDIAEKYLDIPRMLDPEGEDDQVCIAMRIFF